MTDIFQSVLLILVLTISLSAYFLVVGALFAGRVSKSQRILIQTTGRAFGVGLVNFLFFGVLALVLFSLAENAVGFIKAVLTIPGLFITAFLTVLLSFGLAGVVNELGLRLFPQASSWRQMTGGSIVLTFACALPFIGWFLLFPYVAFLGIGAAILGFLQRET